MKNQDLKGKFVLYGNDDFPNAGIIESVTPSGNYAWIVRGGRGEYVHVRKIIEVLP